MGGWVCPLPAKAVSGESGHPHPPTAYSPPGGGKVVTNVFTRTDVDVAPCAVGEGLTVDGCV
jgi:hypothetical protein